jgi:hypothetical protein
MSTRLRGLPAKGRLKLSTACRALKKLPKKSRIKRFVEK